MELLKEFSFLFGRERMHSAFKSVKKDMELLKSNHNDLKHSINDWIIFLHNENKLLKEKIAELEAQNCENKMILREQE